MGDNESVSAVDQPTDLVNAFLSPIDFEQRLANYGRSRKLFVDWLLSNLKPGIDYMVIHRKVRGNSCPRKDKQQAARCEVCDAKPSLLKPGAEKICGLLQVIPRFRKDTEVWEMLGSPAGTIALLCEGYTADGRIVAEGRGVRNVDQDNGDANKTVKMTEKSGNVDMALRLGGASEMFTLDIEDMTPKTADETAEEAIPMPHPTDEAPPRTLNKGECDSLEGAITNYAKKWTWKHEKLREAVKRGIYDRYQKERIDQLTLREAMRVGGWLEQWDQRDPPGPTVEDEA